LSNLEACQVVRLRPFGLLAGAALFGALLSVAASAQGGGGFGRGGNGRGGFGRGASLPRAPGVEVPQVLNAVNLLVEHRQDLALTDTQFKRVIVVKRTLDSTNSPLMRKLDSVQRLFKRGPLFSSGSPERRDSLAEANSLVRETIAAVRENNESGRDQAYALLSSRQLDAAHALEAKAEQQIQEAAAQSRQGKGGRPPSG
jgi:hypothetical protein